VLQVVHLSAIESYEGTHLLFSRVGVVEADEEATVVVLGKVRVEDGGLGVTDVEVARRFGRKPRHDLSLFGVLETEFEGGIDLGRRLGLRIGSSSASVKTHTGATYLSLATSEVLVVGDGRLDAVARIDKAEPPGEVRMPALLQYASRDAIGCAHVFREEY
jgi:hypothetical protein